MSNFEVQPWKEYTITSLFDITLSKDDLQPKKLQAGKFPLVSSGKVNNGVCAFIEKQPAAYLYDAGILTIDMFGKAFYHAKPFYAVSHGRVIILKPKTMLSRAISLYLVSVIEATIRSKYSFTNMCCLENLKSVQIKLKTCEDNAPDWDYMEQYISNLENRLSLVLDNLQGMVGDKKNPLNTGSWQTFAVSDVFNKLDLKTLKKDFNKKIDVSEEQTDEFSLPLVNAKHFNNGIQYYGREKDFESAEMTIDVVKNGAIATGDVYPQPQKTGVLWDAYLLKPKAEVKSARVLKFLATVLEKSIKEKFAWNDKCVWDRVKVLDIKLPVNSNGKIDFDYMEKYISSLETVIADKLDKLEYAISETHSTIETDKKL